jgi:branched-chain amino acid transport system ATP-binding protein
VGKIVCAIVATWARRARDFAHAERGCDARLCPPYKSARDEKKAVSEPVLETRSLSMSFGGLRAVDNVSLKVERNRITTVIGPNGAGKSTLFNLISGALRPLAGQVRIDGIDYTGAPPYRLHAAGVARSFQITNLMSELPVAENLRLAAQVLERPHRLWLPISASHIARARVLELLERFGLADKAQVPVARLSHGDQRRLEVAVALASRPRLIMLDEPTQGMSHGDTEDTAALIRSLSADVTVLLIEHDIGLVMSLSDHVVVMHQGQKIAEGSPRQVRDNPLVQTAYFGQA